jgi:hypothetical protein
MSQQICLQTLLRKKMAADAVTYRKRMLKMERDLMPCITLEGGKLFYSSRHFDLVTRLIREDRAQTVNEILDQISGGDYEKVQNALNLMKTRGLARIAGTRKRGQFQALVNTWVGVPVRD